MVRDLGESAAYATDLAESDIRPISLWRQRPKSAARPGSTPARSRRAEPASRDSPGEIAYRVAAVYFFSPPLIWNSATDFPATLLGTISV